MGDNSKLEFVDSDNLSSPSKASELRDSDMGGVQINSMQQTTTKSDTFVVDMERFSHLADKDVTKNSRITLQRSLSRKGSQRGAERKTNSGNGNGSERDIGLVSISPKAKVLAGGTSTPEKSTVVTIMGTTDHIINPQIHHQTTITNGSVGATTACTIQSKCSGKRFSFRRSSSGSWAIDPRRILFFFATLSSVGTILLIYFTLSLSKPSADDSTLNW